MGHGGMMGMMAMQDPIARLLDHQADLRLTSAQVNSLIAIDDKLQADNRPMRERLAGWGRSMRGAMGSGDDRKKPDSAQMAMMRTMHDSAMTVMRSVRENNWRAQSAAYAVLTPDQLTSAAQLGARGGDGRGPMGGGGPRGGMGAGAGPQGPGGAAGRGGMPGGFSGRRGMMRGGPGGPPNGD
jgi:hypothetical protein